MRRFGNFVVASAIFAICAWPAAAPARAADILVFAAASAADALAEVNRDYAAGGGARIAVSAASSGMLARQIDNGAPADVFVSANPEWVEYLAKRGLLAAEHRRPLLRNRLALIAPAASTVRIVIGPGVALAQALGDGRLAISDPRYVPAGRYAKAALVALGVWDDVARKTAIGRNVRETLVRVERGEVPLGIVYATDAAASKKVRLVALFPPESHPPIVYWAAVVAERARPEVAAYFRHLGSAQAGAVFRRHGFGVD
jgi:molybdate transport system substrate-binding protein